MSKSSRGPLPAFGGPASKAYYVCKMCKKEVRRDKICEHYGVYVDMSILNQTDGRIREQALARLTAEKRTHTEGVKDFFDSNSKLPLDYNNTEYWTRAAQPVADVNRNIFTVKRKNTVEEEQQPPQKKQSNQDTQLGGDDDTVENPVPGTSTVVDVGASIEKEGEIEIIKDAFETPEPLIVEEPKDKEEVIGNVEIRNEMGTKDTIKEALIEALKDPQAAEMLADQIAMKIKKLQEDDSKSDITESYWVEGEDYVSCSFCTKYSGNEHLPVSLRKFRKGNFGRIILDNEQFHIRRSQKIHEANDLHKWCVMMGKILEEEAIKEDRKNEKAAENTVRNVLFALMNGGGSELFVGLMDKDNLTEGIEAPTKNDSKKTFFDLRDIISEEVNKRIKTMFSEVSYITVTLDKVTVGHISYMVILTYFFYKGRIHICLNSLEKMQEEDYDGPGTASMLVKVLRESTGWSRPQLAQKLVHMTYDGVFAETNERVRGGGFLSLRSHMCAELGLEQGSISGDWDAAHNMQLTWSDLIKKHPEIMKTVDCYFNIMKLHKLGKVGTHFMNRAKELGYLVLTNKQHQTTRFVRALLRGLTAALRNLPTLEIVLNEEIRDMELAGKNDKVNKLNKSKRLMKDSKHILFVIGLMQILEIYAEASMGAQHATYFPTEVWAMIKAAKDDLKELAENWKWKESDLKLGQCGNPSLLVNQIMSTGIYSPHVSDSVIRKNQTFLKTYHGVDAHMDFGRYGPDDLFDEDDQIVIDLAGEMKVEKISDEVKMKVEKNLEKICKDLIKAWDERQSETELQKTSIKAFGQSYSPEPDKIAEFYQAREKDLESVVETVPGTLGEKFEPSEMVDGYAAWNKYLCQGDYNVPMNKKWTLWIQKLLKDEKYDDYAMFIEFFEFVEIRSMSEAMAETVGSVMNINNGTGRQLQPVNFSTEICLRFNLGPLHTLSGLIKDIVKQHHKNFFRKAPPKNLNLTSSSSAIATYRSKEEAKSHVPYTIFE